MSSTYRRANNEGAISVQSCAGTNLRQMFRIRRCDDGRTGASESLSRQQYIDIESYGVRRRSASSSGLSPQFRCKAKGIVGQRQVPVRSRAHECVQAGNSNDLIRPQQFPLDLVIHNCRHKNASACTETP